MFDYSVDGDGVATITWDIPDRPVNVMNEATMEAFREQVEKTVADDAVKGVIIASAKSDFIAGADIEKFLEDRTVEETLPQFLMFDALGRMMEIGGKPFVAAINGHALGGGFEVTLCCHHRVASNNPKTRIGLPEITLGVLPGGGGTQRIPRMLGIQTGLQLLLDGKKYTVDQAKEIGLVDEVVEPDALLARAKEWVLTNPEATQPWDRKGFRIPGGGVQSPMGAQLFPAAIAMTRKKTYGNYPAAEAILSCVYEGLQTDIETGLRVESKYLTKMVCHPVTKALIRTGFFEMANARKLKGRPKDIPKTEFKKIGVVGAGMMGAGISFVSAKAGLEVAMLDNSVEAAEKGKERYRKQLDKRIQSGRMNEEAAEALLNKISPTESYDALAGSDLIVEAVFENREIKADVTAKAEAVIGDDALFASNTSTLPITGLAENSSRPESFIGIHFFSPVERMPLVEIIRGEKTSKESVAKALDYVQRINMTPIVVNDGRGFFTSRVFSTYVLEGMAMLQEGVSPALIENAARIAGMPVGPLEVVDNTSLKLSWDVRNQWKRDLGEAFVPHPADSVLELFMETLGRPGRAGGKGFYDWPKDGPKRLWPDLEKHFPVAAAQPDAEEIKTRLLHIQAIEALRCREENVITNRADADVGSILGWGFPAYTGGVLSYVGQIGAERLVTECEALANEHGDRFAPPSEIKELAA